MTEPNIHLGSETVASLTIQQIRTNVKETLELAMGESSPEMLDEMSTIFLEDALPIISKMKDALEEQDFIAINMCVHALKGSSATIGLAQFADLCEILELSVAQQDVFQIKSLVGTLEMEYILIENALQTFQL